MAVYTAKKTLTNICDGGKNCPLLDGDSISKIVADRDYWQETAVRQEKAMALAEKEILKLRQENCLLAEKNKSLQNQIKHLCQRPFKRNLKKEVDDKNKGSKPLKKKGAPVGHKGRGRKRPEKKNACYVDILPQQCDKCGCKNITVYPSSFQEHYVQDIVMQVITTCYRTHYGYCPECKKTVYPTESIDGLLANSRIGPNAIALSGYFRYLGIPYRKTARIFKDVFGLDITHPSLLEFDTKMAENGKPIFDALLNRIKNSLYVHVDETGWRVDGENQWLWNFVNQDTAVFRINKSRGSNVVEKTLGKQYEGTLISDFYSAYNPVSAKAQQKCLAHLLRDIKKIQEENTLAKQDADFCRKLKKTLKAAMEAWRKAVKHEISKIQLQYAKKQTAEMLARLCLYKIENEKLQNIVKRMVKHHNQILTFMDDMLVEPTNNRAERTLRPSVIMRKITFGNRTESGAANHSVIMSIIQSGILNRQEPIDIFRALTQKENPP
jgi:transposase